MTTSLDWIDELELPEIALFDAYNPDHLRYFARTAVAEYAARQEVVLWQYRWGNPTRVACLPRELAWKEVEIERGQTIDDAVDEIRVRKYEGNPSYEVRALCVKSDL